MILSQTHQSTLASAAPPADVCNFVQPSGEAKSFSNKPPDGGSPACLAIDIVINDEDWSAFADPVFGDSEAIVTAAAHAVALWPALNPVPSTVTIALSCDAEVAQLNGTFRGKLMPTNVLSFPDGGHPGNEDSKAPRSLGDLIIARETVLAEAADLHIPVGNHLAHLVVHGLLHLLGYDHETDCEADRMEALETSILATLDIPNPYADSDPVTVGLQHLDGGF